MTYAALTNWRYDKNLYHKIQSGPQRTGDQLDLTDTYKLVSSGFKWTDDQQQSFYTVIDQGTNFGIITPGPPNLSGYFSTQWRQVPTAVSGFWTDYTNIPWHVSGALNIYNGFRYQSLYHTANATVQTALGPQPGLINHGAYTWFGNAVPDNQRYDPFQTPADNTPQEGSTGGPNSYQRARFPMLTNPTNDSSGSRRAWKYHQPVYCQTFVETVRSGQPGFMSTAIRRMYRGRSTRYVSNYASIYGVNGEGVRNIIRTFSSTVNSSNQKRI